MECEHFYQHEITGFLTSFALFLVALNILLLGKKVVRTGVPGPSRGASRGCPRASRNFPLFPRGSCEDEQRTLSALSDTSLDEDDRSHDTDSPDEDDRSDESPETSSQDVDCSSASLDSSRISRNARASSLQCSQKKLPLIVQHEIN